ncbi:MAG: uracil-DNA glycosylase family protein [Novosphingobium sp.]
MRRPASELESQIHSAYLASGNTLGWRFLYSPLSVLNHSDVAFIGLNPGGAEIEPNLFALEKGSAYRDEVWWEGCGAGGSPLQIQVQTLFQMLDVNPERVLAGNLVPFRSPCWETLRNPSDALAFGRRIWGEILRKVRPRLVVAMGEVARSEVARALGIDTLQSFPTGWGSVKAFRGETNGITLVGIPHLSRFQLMRRSKSAREIADLFHGFVAPSG